MLTVDEIKNISFKRSNIRGYAHEEVDAFIDEVIETVEQLRRDKADLIRKMDILAKRVEQYRADEETVRNALLSSQRVADAAIRDAKAKAEKIITDANEEATAIIESANAVAAMQKENYTALLADAVELKEELLYVYKKHISIIEELPGEADLDAKKAEVDKKYPTIKQEEKTEVASEISSESTKAVPQQPAADDTIVYDVPSRNIENEENFDVEQKKTSKKGSKFDNLKFGADYKIDNE